MDLPQRSRTSVAAGLAFTGNVSPHDPETGGLVEPGHLAERTAPATAGLMFFDVPERSVLAQAAMVYENLAALLAERGLGLGQVARQRLFLTDVRDLPAVERVMDIYLQRPLPATTVVIVPRAGLESGLRIYLDAVAVVEPAWARTPDGDDRYPQTIRAGAFRFLSAIDGVAARGGAEPDSSGPEAPEDYLRTIREVQGYREASAVFGRLGEILAERGSSLNRILKVNGWVRLPMREYGAVVLARNRHFDRTEQAMLASTGLRVRGVGSAEALLAFDAIALADESSVKVVSGAASPISSPYVAGAAMGGGLVFTSGEIPVATSERQVVSRATQLADAGRWLRMGRIDQETGIEARTWQVYRTLERHMDACRSSFTDVVHQTVFIKEPRLLPGLEAVAQRFFAGDLPPTTVIPIVDTTPFPTAELEIELVARQPAG